MESFEVILQDKVFEYVIVTMFAAFSRKNSKEIFPFDTHIQCYDHFFSRLKISFHVKYAGSKFLIKLVGA